MMSLDSLSVKINDDDDDNHNNNDDDKKNSPHVATQGLQRVLKSAGRIVPPYSQIFVPRPLKVQVERLSAVPFSLLLNLQLKPAEREQPKVGNDEGKTLTFAKQSHSHGNVDVSFLSIFIPSFLGIREDGKQRNVHLGDGQYKLSTNSTSLLVSAMSNYNKFEF